MLEYLLSPDEALLVAARGSTETDGLFHWQIQNKEWVGKQMATVDQLSTLISHPFLPVVYGLSGMLESGYLHAWSVFGDVGTEIGMKSTLGGEPCHLAIDPSGKFLVIANYTSSALAVQELDFNGEFLGEIKLTELQGGSVDPDRQDAAHPHQVLFLNQYLIVIDLGSDLVRKFVFDPSKGASNCLSTIEIGKLPAGTGPRHAVVLPDNRLAISGELNETLSVGHPNGSETDWSICPSTRQTGKAKTRPPRNYPGDIKASIDGQKVYFANRGHDTISTFDVGSASPQLLSEQDSGVDWPQHLLVHNGHLIVAGWETSQVVAMELIKGVPAAPKLLFECSGAGWLLVFKKQTG